MTARSPRLKIVLFLLGAVVIFLALDTLYQGLNTLRQLDFIESERDRWQRPAEILQALSLREGAVVMDLGSGAGYFALKLSPAVGPHGTVLAVDLRRLSLAFLWIRGMERSPRNIAVTHRDVHDLRLDEGSIDAVLIANTYHELTDRKPVLDSVFRWLRPAGRLVIVDRDPESIAAELPHPEISAARVESELRQSGFAIIRREDGFARQPGNGPWWLLVAEKL